MTNSAQRPKVSGNSRREQGLKKVLMTKRRRTIEKPFGRGHIPLADGQSVHVRHSLVVIQMADDEVETGDLAGQIEIRGAIEVDQGQGMIDLAGKPFTLKLADGRCLEALAKKGDPVTRQWEIAATSPKGLHRC
jgi:hypothetical protein